MKTLFSFFFLFFGVVTFVKTSPRNPINEIIANVSEQILGDIQAIGEHVQADIQTILGHVQEDTEAAGRMEIAHTIQTIGQHVSEDVQTISGHLQGDIEAVGAHVEEAIQVITIFMILYIYFIF